MAKKKPKRNGTVSETLKSPFSSERIEVILKSTTLHVHRALLADKSQLYYTGPDDPNSVLSSSGDHVRLDNTSLEVGHVLVMWLYTGTYQLLPGLDGAEPPTRDAVKTAVGVYTLARQYTLAGLEGLARDQITLLVTELGIYTAIDIIIETFPSPSKHDAWLSEFLSTRMKEALQNDTVSADLLIELCEPEGATLLTKTIVKTLLDAYREKSETLAAREVALQEKFTAKEAALEEKLATREAAMEERLAAKEAALEGAARILVAQQTSFALDNATKKSAMVPPPEPPVSKGTSAPEPSKGSDCELAPEDVPSVFAAAVIEELAMPRPASASPENDWVVTTPPAAEPEPEKLVDTSRCKWCMKKKCKNTAKGLKCKKAPSTPEPEEPKIPCEPEAESENVEEPAALPDLWGFGAPKNQPGWGFGAKKNLGFGTTSVAQGWGFGVGAKEEEQNQKSDPEPELEPASELEFGSAALEFGSSVGFGSPVVKKDKKKNKARTSIWGDLEAE